MLPSGVTLDVSDDVRGWYLDSVPSAPLWTTGEGLTARGRDVAQVLRQLRDEGLGMELLEGTVLDGTDITPDGAPASAGRLATAEILLSEALVTAARHLNGGRIDPSTVDAHWKLATDDAVGPRILSRMSAGDDAATVLDEVRPELPWYSLTVKALGDYRRRAASGDWPRVDLGGASKLERGSRGEAVQSVRRRLAQGMDPRERDLVAGASDPALYDEGVENAVRAFQKRHGIAVDGIVGGSTLEALNVGVDERIHELLLSLERMRWLPNELGPRAIFVNVAGFEMHVLENGEPVLSQDVVVGQPDWPTVLFSDTLEHIVFNPYWHVPESIERAEVLPAVRKDPDYLYRNNYVVVVEGNNYGSPVSTAGFDWYAPDVMDGLDFRQEPGPNNALGRMKFLFPNDHNIYLHDTPAVAKFAENQRAFSHGCIRLSDPEALARYLLDEATSRSASALPGILSKRERAVVSTERIPVHLAYLTSWADEDGTVYFHPDIYDRNENFREYLTDR